MKFVIWSKYNKYQTQYLILYVLVLCILYYLYIYVYTRNA